MANASVNTKIADAVAGHRSGMALAGTWYVDPDIYQQDLRLLGRHWLCAGHTSELAEPGAYILYELGGESVIIIRGQDDVVRALANVCRHRGSRLCEARQGVVRLLTCPYHAWAYRADGTLLTARGMAADFRPEDHSLRSYPVTIKGGLIFVALTDTPLPFGDFEPAMDGFLRAYGWADAKIAHRATFTVAANWKLTVENYLECYHCGPAHPEFSLSHSTALPHAAAAAGDNALRRLGEARELGIVEYSSWGRTGLEAEMGNINRSALYPGYVTGSQDGAGVAPLMGRFAEYDGGCTYMEVGPLSTFLGYPDHGLIYRFIPRGPLHTEMEVLWLVRETAVEGVDYDLARLTWLWTVTSEADKKIVQMNQDGVASMAYLPGPYAEMEHGTRSFIDRYVQESWQAVT